MINLELKLKHWTRFRWVTCQLDVLAKCSSLHQLRKALHSLPTTLEETYNRILLCIRKDSRSDVVRLLQWLAFSARPLALSEMAEVFVIDRDKLRFDPDQRPRAILDICSSLVKVSHTGDGDTISVRGSGTLSLDLSVKEYLIFFLSKSGTLLSPIITWTKSLLISPFLVTAWCTFCNLVLSTACATKVKPQYHSVAMLQSTGPIMHSRMMV